MGDRERTPILPPEGEVPLGTRIRARRWFTGIWLTDMAARVGGYTPAHISQIETGNVRPSPELLKAICRELRISEQELRAAPRGAVQAWIEQGAHGTRKGRHAAPKPAPAPNGGKPQNGEATLRQVEALKIQVEVLGRTNLTWLRPREIALLDKAILDQILAAGQGREVTCQNCHKLFTAPDRYLRLVEALPTGKGTIPLALCCSSCRHLVWMTRHPAFRR